MTEEKKEALAAIEARKGLVCDVADHIWEYAELSLQEFKSAALYCEVLEKEGFRVKKGISGIETAFSARNNLVCDDSVAKLISFYVLTHLNDSSEEFMSRNKRRLYP